MVRPHPRARPRPHLAPRRRRRAPLAGPRPAVHAARALPRRAHGADAGCGRRAARALQRVHASGQPRRERGGGVAGPALPLPRPALLARRSLPVDARVRGGRGLSVGCRRSRARPMGRLDRFLFSSVDPAMSFDDLVGPSARAPPRAGARADDLRSRAVSRLPGRRQLGPLLRQLRRGLPHPVRALGARRRRRLRLLRDGAPALGHAADRRAPRTARTPSRAAEWPRTTRSSSPRRCSTSTRGVSRSTSCARWRSTARRSPFSRTCAIPRASRRGAGRTCTASRWRTRPSSRPCSAGSGRAGTARGGTRRRGRRGCTTSTVCSPR